MGLFPLKSRMCSIQNRLRHFLRLRYPCGKSLLQLFHQFCNLVRISHGGIQNCAGCGGTGLGGESLRSDPCPFSSFVLMQHGQAGGQIGAGRAENDIIPVIFRHFQQAFNGGFVVPLCSFERTAAVGRLCKL